MKTLMLVCLLAGVCGEDFTSVHHDLAESHTNLGLDLLRISAQNSGNAFLSPASISAALSLTYLGSDGETRKELGRVLGYDEDESRSLSAYEDIVNHLTSICPLVQLSMANRIYGAQGFSVKQSYVDATAEYLDADYKSVDFGDSNTREEINDWVADQTQDKIKDLLKTSDITADTVTVLVNAIYFKAVWQNGFLPSKTETDADFKMGAGKNTVKVDYMHKIASYPLTDMTQGPGRMLELSYKCEGTTPEVAMYIILPKEDFGLCDVQDVLTARVISDTISKLQLKSTKIQIPKFTLNYRRELNEMLTQAGMGHMFTGAADFSRMTDDRVKVSKTIHQAYLEVNENGTEAAAATAITIVRTSLPIVDEEFIVDHPFIFFIYDKKSRSLLFAGRVLDPSDKVENDGSDYRCVKTGKRTSALVADGSSQGATQALYVFSILTASLLAACMLAFC